MKKEELIGQVRTWAANANSNVEFTEKEWEALEEIVALIKKEVTEEWIWKAIEYIKEYPTYHRLEEKLKEAGVEVKK